MSYDALEKVNQILTDVTRTASYGGRLGCVDEQKRVERHVEFMSNDQLRLAVLNLVAAEVQRSRSLHSLVDAKIHGDMRKIRADVMSDFITFVENYNFISNPVQFGYSVGLFVNQEKSS